MHADGQNLIRLPIVDSRENYLEGFWQWVQRLSQGDYQGAFEGICWPQNSSWTAESLNERVTTFFGGPDPWTVIIPNERLIKVINEATLFRDRNETNPGWLLAQIPLTTDPQESKRDDIFLMGLAASFFFRQIENHYVMEFEIFHL